MHSRIETEEYLIERLEVKFYLTIHYGIFLSVITFHFFKVLFIISDCMPARARRSEEDVESLETGVTGSCMVPTSVGAGNQSRAPTGTVSNRWAPPPPAPVIALLISVAAMMTGLEERGISGLQSKMKPVCGLVKD